MKKIILPLLILSLFSCTKRDQINHYLNEEVTQEKLLEDGFYKYSYTYTYENDEDEKDTRNGKVYKSVIYSNVKPKMEKDGKLYPIAFFGGNNTKEDIDYLKNQLHDRIITYFFVNDTLENKSIYVYSANAKKNVADFTTKNNIIHYYDSLKIPIKQMLINHYDSIELPLRFRINRFETGFYIFKDASVYGYEMFTTYRILKKNELPYYSFMAANPRNMFDWYRGHTYEYEK